MFVAEGAENGIRRRVFRLYVCAVPSATVVDLAVFGPKNTGVSQ